MTNDAEAIAMNCEQSRRLLPLWIGNDLSDTTEVEALRAHVAACPKCREQQRRLQLSLDALQTISTSAMVSILPSRTALKKQFRRPVWQATPVWSTCRRTQSLSQSQRNSTSVWIWPDSSPLRHSLPREREK